MSGVVGQEIGQRKVDAKLAHHRLQHTLDRVGYRNGHVFLGLHSEQDHRFPVIDQLGRSVVAGQVDHQPVRSPQYDLDQVTDVQWLAARFHVNPQGSRLE